LADIQTVGRVGVAVQPDTSKFLRDARAAITRDLRNLTAQIPITVDPDRVRRDLRAAVRSAAQGVRCAVPIDFIPGVAQLRARLEAVVRAASRGVRAEVEVDADGGSLSRALASLTGSSGGGGPGRALSALSGSFRALTSSVAGLAAAGGAVQVLGGLAAAAAQLAPVALLGAGAVAGLGAAVAAYRIGTAGFSEALSGDAEALARLAPSARATVEALQGLKPAFDQVRRSTQEALFAGFAEQVQTLGNQYLPLLQSKLPAVASGLNEIGKGLLTALQAPDIRSNVGTIFDNVALSLRGARDSLGDFAAGFIELGAFGTSYMTGLGDAIGDTAARFREFVTAGVESGRFDTLIENALQGFRDLGAIIGNVADIVGSIFSGLSAGTGATSFLATLRDTTAALAEFFDSAAAQGPLQALGQTMAVAGAAVRDILLAALRALGPVIEAAAPFVQQFATALGTALPAALNILGPPLAGLVEALAGALGPLLPILAQAFVGLASALAPVVEALTPVVAMIGETLAPIMAQLLPLVVEIATAFGEFLAVAIASLAPLFPPLFEAVGQVLAAVLPLIPPLLRLAADLFPVLAGVISGVVVPAVQFVAGAIQALAPIIGFIIGVVQGFVRILRGDFTAVQGFFRDLPGNIVRALGNLGNLLLGAGRAILDGFLRGLKDAWRGVTDFVGGIATWIRNNKGPLSYDKRLLLPAGKAIMDGLYRGLDSEFGRVQALVSGIADGIVGTFSEPVDVSIRADADRMLSQLPTGSYSAEISSAVSADNFGVATVDDLIDALEGARFEFDGDGIARIVNKSNTRKARRR
jgi:phage-related protein